MSILVSSMSKRKKGSSSQAVSTSPSGGASAPRSSSYVKENDFKFGVRVASRVINTGVVNGLRCRFCIAFGREDKAGSKRKTTSLGQTWITPFRYDNIDAHMKTQHAVKWSEFEEAKSSWGGLDCETRLQECDNFFLQNHCKRISSVKGHFSTRTGTAALGKTAIVGDALTNRQQYIFVIKKEIVDTIIGDMFHCPPQTLLGGNNQSVDEDDNDNVNIEDNGNNPTTNGGGDQVITTFGSSAEHDAVIADRFSSYQEMKRRAMAIFE